MVTGTTDTIEDVEPMAIHQREPGLSKERILISVVSILAAVAGWMLITIVEIRGNRFTDVDGDNLRTLVQDNSAAIRAIGVQQTQGNTNVAGINERIDSFRFTVFDNKAAIAAMVTSGQKRDNEIEKLQNRVDVLATLVGDVKHLLTKIEVILEDKPPKWLTDRVSENSNKIETLERALRNDERSKTMGPVGRELP
jgi:predicted RNase H-like nuclease (RuvC/YqgF family)